MAEYLSNTHTPGSDGALFGQGLLYDWMRILAGGGTCEFSAIQMRGPLTIQNGQQAVSDKYALNVVGATNQYGYPVASLEIANVGGTQETLPVGSFTVPSAADRMGCKNTSGETINCVVSASVAVKVDSLAGGPGLGTCALVALLNGVPQTGLSPEATFDAAGQTFIISGSFIIKNWATGNDLIFSVTNTATGGITGLISCTDYSMIVERWS